jgi:O-antigen biosynthesis protein
MKAWLRRIGWRPPAALAPDSSPADGEYERWLALHDTPSQAESAAVWRVLGDDPPSISLIVDPRKASAAAVERSLKSIEAQTYSKLSVAIRPFDGESALRTEGEFVGMITAGDVLSPHAAAVLAAYLVANPDAELVYSDEDQIDDLDRRHSPYFKPDWSPDLSLAQDYACRMALLRRQALQPFAGRISAPARVALNEIILRLSEPGGRIVHAPYVLYHRSIGASDRGNQTAMRSSANRHLCRLGSRGRVAAHRDGARAEWRRPDPAPLVSLIVPTRDRVDLLANCIDGLQRCTDYPNLEVLILDNESTEAETHAFFDRVTDDRRFRVVHAPGPFNYPAINNLGAREARGEIIGLMNNDLAFTDPVWLSEMVSQACRPGVGAVGALLLYGDGSVQHAGCVLGIGGVASHVYKRRDPSDPGHGGRLQIAQDMSAVTAACLLTPRSVWTSLGGMDEDLAVAYNDVDYCLRVREAGLRVIWTPHARVFHLESSTRGDDKTGERRARLEAEKAKMAARWGDALLRDPFFSPNLSLGSTDCRPAFPPRRQLL